MKPLADQLVRASESLYLIVGIVELLLPSSSHIPHFGHWHES